MKATLLIAVALTIVALCSAADPECKYRRLRSLALHWANPTDCTRYFRCTNKNVMREIVCAEGKAYNANTGRCTTNEQGLCKLTLLAPLIEPLNPCADEVSGAYLPQTGYCRTFYICNDNKAYPQACEAGSFFNATSGNCIPDTNTKCWQNKCLNQTDGTYLADTSSCTSFYVCANGEAIGQNCGNGSFFNSSREICEPDATGQYCWENLCFQRTDGDFVKDAKDCYSYYVCAGGTPIKQFCPNGSYFESIENSCIPGVCPTETTTAVAPTETTTCSVETTTACSQETTTQCIEVTTPFTTTACHEETTTAYPTVPTVTGRTCPGGYKNGELIPFPNFPQNCDKYYICMDGTMQQRECAQGNIFNAKLSACVPDTNHVCWPIDSTVSPGVYTTPTGPTVTDCTTVTTTTECTCPGGYTNGELIPFPNFPQNCDKYYICMDGTLQERECGQGNLFNAKLSACVPDTNHVCWPIDSTVSPGVYITPTGPAVTDCTTVPTVTEYTCPGGYTNGELIPFPNFPQNCDKYYICMDGTLQERECGQGNLFNAKLSACVPDTNHVCWPIDGTASPGVYTTPTGPTVTDCTTVPTTSECTCPGGYTNGELIPFPNFPQNCDKYYICMDGTLQERECGQGNLFNAKLSACVPDTNHVCWPIDSTVSPGVYTTPTGPAVTDCTTVPTVTEYTCPGGYTNGELIPFPNFPQNCDKYYICMDGTLQERECGQGNLFNAKLSACVPDTNHVCWPIDGTASPGVYTTPTGPTVTDCTTVPTTSECTCPGGYTNGELIPFPNFPHNCDKYYICMDGTLQERECGQGNLFNAKLSACVPDTNHVCWPIDSTASPGVYTTPTGPTVTDCTTVPTTTECTCPGGYTNGELIPFPNFPQNCDKYYICMDGTLQERECGQGNLFNAKLSACVPDTNHVCWPIDSTASLGVYTTPTGPTVTDCTTVPTTSECTCPGGYTNGELIPFPNFPHNCDKYYICMDGTLQERECGQGNLFNAKLSACVPDTNHVCWPIDSTVSPGVYTTPTGPTVTDCTTAPTVTECTCPGGYTDGELLPFPNYPDNCYKYYICTNGRLEERECGIGNRFDSSLGVCVPDTDNTCRPNLCNGQPDGTTVADFTNCSSFYLCEGGKGQIYECPAEKWFNPVYQVCMADYNATCINPCRDTTGIIFLPNPDCSKYFLCNGGQPFVETCASGGFDINLGKCKDNAVCEATLCAGKEDGTTFSVVGNDTLFYLCLGGVAQIAECTPGHVYNAAIGVCFATPSPKCDQSKCYSSTPEDGAFAPLTNTDDTAFCLCRNGGAFLHHCTDNYIFRADLGICYSNAPCDPEICDVYPENTRSQNRNDTQSFCLCVSKVQVIVDCPNNQTYNPVSQLCQSPDDKCASNVCLAAPDYTIFPALNDNTSGFCMCLNSDAVYKSCESGTQFNVDKKICLSTTTDECSNSMCVGNIGLIFGITGDPHSFCYCTIDGIAIKERCPNSEMFNQTLLICQAVGCNGQVCLTNPSEPFPPDNDPYSFCICAGTEPSSVTKHTCQNGTRFDPYYLMCKEDPCSKSICADLSNDGLTYATNNYPQDYCVCTNGIPVLHNCPIGSLFNSTAGTCTSATNSQCELASCANATSKKTYPVAARSDTKGFCYCFSSLVVEFFSCPNEASFDPIRGICNVVMPIISNPPGGNAYTCPGGYAEGQILPNPTNCRLYYICCNGQLKEFDCGAGNFFDKVTFSCQPLGRSFEFTNKQLLRSAPIPEDNIFCVENEKHAVSTNCTQYEICIDSIWIRLTCPNAWYYNAEQHRCMEPRDDTVCAYAHVQSLPLCIATMEERTVPAKATNCAQYYRCTQGKWHLSNCPQQHFYSKHLHTCIPSENSDLCEARNKLANSLQHPATSSTPQCQHMMVRPYEHNCAMYIMCLEGRWWYQYCALGMYFNTSHNYCMPNTDGQCAIATSAIYDENFAQQCDLPGAERVRSTLLACNQYYECHAGYWQLRTCDGQQYFNDTVKTCLSDTDGACNALNNNNCTEGARREFPFNCTAYQICIRGVWQRANCNTYWSFDNLLQICVPNDGSCADNGLRQVCRMGDTRAHPLPENCTQFYYCLNESWTTVNCLNGNFYQKELGACVPHAEDNQCQPWSAVLSMQQSIDTNKSVYCVGHADGRTAPHPDNCLYFFVCIAGEATNVQKCVKGSYYDAELGYCRPNDGKCVVPLSGVCANAADGAYVPHPDDCSAYYHCSTLNGTELLYCAEGDYFRNSTNECRTDNGECRAKLNAASKCTGALQHGKRLQHERYCNIYFACVRGLAIPAACPANQQFNAAVGHCVFNATLTCENGTLSEVVNSATTLYSCANFTAGIHLPVIADCTKYLVCSADLELMRSCPTGTYFDAAQRLCLPDDGSCPYVVRHEQPAVPDANVCEGKHGTLMPNAFNCNEFYVCINGKLHLERCYLNQYFDSTKNQCLPYKFAETNGNITKLGLENVQHIKVNIPNVECNDKVTNYTELCTFMPHGTLIAEQGDCRRFISCNELGEPISQRCRNGESFDSLLGVCRQNDGTCLLENGQRVGECNGRHGQFVRDADNCRGYFVCINGQKISRECGENELFDKNLSSCQEDVNNACGASMAKPTKLQVVFYSPTKFHQNMYESRNNDKDNTDVVNNQYISDENDRPTFDHCNNEENVDFQSNSNKRHFQIRIDSVDDESTAPITESNSREDLIASNERITETPIDIPRFLSVPALRNYRPYSDYFVKRQISSSPAKSERAIRSNPPECKMRARRLSQDSGIVSGRLFGGFENTFLDTVVPTKHFIKSSDNLYSFLINEANTKSCKQQQKQDIDRQSDLVLNETNDDKTQATTPCTPKWIDRQPTTQKAASYTEKWISTTMSRAFSHLKSNSTTIPLPTHLEAESAEPSPTQAFGPKVVNIENIPGTAMHRGLGLHLNTPLVEATDRGTADTFTDDDRGEMIESSHSNEFQDQFGYKQLMAESRKGSKGSIADSNLNGSRRSSKSCTGSGNEGNIRRISKQDREGLDPESLMFRDGRRKVDMVLAWEEEDFGVMTEAESRRRDYRRCFMENLIKEGLEVELEDKIQSFNEKTYFLKIHLPWRLETRLAEVMNIKLPTKRFITISVKASWDEENVVARNMHYWKSVWNRLTRKIQLDQSVLEGETTFKAATANGNPEEQFIVKDRATAYTSAQRSLMVMQVLIRTPFDDSDRVGIRRLLNDSTYLACFPLHEGRYDCPHSSGVSFDRRTLYLTWAHPSQWYKKQPLCLIRKYFGDKIALYFCWLGFYTEMLVYPAVVGTLCFLYGLASIDSEDNTPSKEICNEYGTGNITLCPLCDKACSYQSLHESCTFSRLTYLFDNPSTVFFAIFMSFWATTFLELWKRKQSVLVWEWDLHNVDSDEENRPEFEANATTFRMNPVTREKEPYMSTWSRAIRFVITGSAVFFMISVVLSAVLGTIIYRISLVSVIYGGGGFFVKEHAKLFTTITAALINLVVIMILTRIYHRMALRLTNLENPRTHTEYEDSYTFKIFFFEFMNFYSSLIYIAFFKGRFFDYPGDDQARKSEFFRLKNDICDPAGCLSELCIQLAIIMVGKQCWNNFMEYLFPKFYNWWRHRKHKAATKDVTHLHMAWEQDYHMQDPGRLALFEEYLEMIIQYGFVTLFVAAFPLAPLFALLNNVAEIRLDAYKMVTQARRPLAERVEDIGAWYGILRIITYTAVVSNAFVIAYTSDFIPRMVYKFVYSETHTLAGYIEHSLSIFNTSDYKEEWGATSSEKDPDICQYRGYRNGPHDAEPYGLSPHYWHVFAARLAFVVTFEHLVFVITGIMQFIIPDIPAEVKTQMQREQLLAKEAKYQHGIKRAQQGDNQDLLSIFREAGSRSSAAATGQSGLLGRGSWARRFSRLSDGLDAHVEVAARPRRSVESTVWEVS
ncbi:uncharacterized protein [Eurosta solidaginis]|uniref:uncharacterized protein n=1 Tax=Eurosta solidaginis TaxID=178769 RepID=UPI0035313EF8